MDLASLKQKLDNIVARYGRKREHFKEVLQRLQEKGNLAQSSRLSAAMEEFAGLQLQAQAFFTDATDKSAAGLASMKLKIKRLYKLYKYINQESKPAWRQWIEAVVVALGMALVLRNFVFSLYHVPTGSAEPNILVGDRLWANKMAYLFGGEPKHGDLVIFDDPRDGYDESSYIQYLWQRYVGLAIPLLGLKEGPINVVKRVIAVPGDVVQGKVENGKTVIYLNGAKLDEPNVNPYPLLYVWREKGFFDMDSVFGILPMLSFLRKKMELVHYTYDPSKPLAQQPFYYMDEKDIYHDPRTGQQIMLHAYSPSFGGHSDLSVDEFGPRTVPKDMYWVMGDSRKNSLDSRYWGYLDKKYVHGRASFVIWSLDSEEAFWLFDLIKHPIDFWTRHMRWSRFFKNLN